VFVRCMSVCVCVGGVLFSCMCVWVLFPVP
jgi:hypothetical protein